MKPKQSFLVRLKVARRRAMRSPAERPVLERLLVDNAKEIEQFMASALRLHQACYEYCDVDMVRAGQAHPDNAVEREMTEAICAVDDAIVELNAK